jgi:L-iditol 2-dehydrogenase
VEIVSSGQIDLAPLITDRFPLSEAASAFSAAAAPRSLKVALQP